MLDDFFSLKNRTAVITGASSHLGKTICFTLCELGANLILVDEKKNEKNINELIQKYKLKYKKQKFSNFSANFLKKKDLQKLILKLKKLKKINILINNAAFSPPESSKGYLEKFENQTTEMWEKTFDVNLKAVFELTKGLSKILDKNLFPSIINISSIYGVYGPDYSIYKGTKMHNPAAYAASKAGLIHLSKWFSKTLSPNIRVNTISPGGIYENQPKKFVKSYSKKTSANRMATKEDFVGIIALLASDASKYITGQNFIIDGGWGS